MQQELEGPGCGLTGVGGISTMFEVCCHFG